MKPARATLIVVLVVAVGVFAVFLGMKLGSNDSEKQAIAAWVQAVGSIAAIIGSVWVVRFQAGTARRERLESILAVADAAVAYADQFDTLLKSANPRLAISMKFHQSVVDSVVGAMSAYPVHEVRNHQGVMAFLAIRDQFIFMGGAMQALLDGPWERPGLRRMLEQVRTEQGPQAVAEMTARTEEMMAGNVQGNIRLIRANHATLKEVVNGLQ